MTMNAETAFLLRRAEEEAILAIRTEGGSAAAAHYELALRYSARARNAMSESLSAFRFGPADAPDSLQPRRDQSGEPER